MSSSLRINIFKIDKFCDFSYDIDYNSRTDLYDTKCPPAVQRKQTKRACYRYLARYSIGIINCIYLLQVSFVSRLLMTQLLLPGASSPKRVHLDVTEPITYQTRS